MTPEQRAAQDEQRQQLVDQLHQQLSDGVATLRNGEQWRSYLVAAARFHTYSPRNVLLLMLQNPEATQVASYRTWQALGRQVRRGEAALRVLGPVTRKVPVLDKHGQPERDDAGNPVTRQQIVGVKPVPVFDVGQTDGEPLPAPPAPQLLTGDAPTGLWEGLTAEVTRRGFTVHRGDPGGRANGITHFRDRTVTVRDDVDPAQAVKTLAHELGHVMLHAPSAGVDVTVLPCHGHVEVEAESVAFIVSQAHGMDTAGYSFNYIAGWAGRDDDAVLATAQRVIAASATVLDGLDTVPATAGQQGQQIRAHDVAERAHTLATDQRPDLGAPGVVEPDHRDRPVAERSITDRLAALRAAAPAPAEPRHPAPTAWLPPSHHIGDSSTELSPER